MVHCYKYSLYIVSQRKALISKDKMPLMLFTTPGNLHPQCLRSLTASFLMHDLLTPCHTARGLRTHTAAESIWSPWRGQLMTRWHAIWINLARVAGFITCQCPQLSDSVTVISNKMIGLVDSENGVCIVPWWWLSFSVRCPRKWLLWGMVQTSLSTKGNNSLSMTVRRPGLPHSTRHVEKLRTNFYQCWFMYLALNASCLPKPVDERAKRMHRGGRPVR